VQLDVSIPGLDRQFIGVARLSVADGEMAPVASLATEEEVLPSLISASQSYSCAVASLATEEEVLPGQTVDAAATTFWSWGRLRLLGIPAPT